MVEDVCAEFGCKMYNISFLSGKRQAGTQKAVDQGMCIRCDMAKATSHIILEKDVLFFVSIFIGVLNFLTKLKPKMFATNSSETIFHWLFFFVLGFLDFFLCVFVCSDCFIDAKWCSVSLDTLQRADVFLMHQNSGHYRHVRNHACQCGYFAIEGCERYLTLRKRAKHNVIIGHFHFRIHMCVVGIGTVHFTKRTFTDETDHLNTVVKFQQQFDPESIYSSILMLQIFASSNFFQYHWLFAGKGNSGQPENIHILYMM